jgi:hypothetical protein
MVVGLSDLANHYDGLRYSLSFGETQRVHGDEFALSPKCSHNGRTT